MSIFRVAFSAVSVAAAVSRNPAARAALRAVPKAIPHEVKMAAFNSAKDAAYTAGVAARRIVPKNLIKD